MSATSAVHRPTGHLLPALQVCAALAVLALLWQFVTAGQLFGQDGGGGAAFEAHEVGAIVLHVFSGLAAIAAAVMWRQGVLRIGVPALAGLVFAFGFLQAALGGYQTLYVHVPGAMILTTGAVWLLVVALRRRSVRA